MKQQLKGINVKDCSLSSMHMLTTTPCMWLRVTYWNISYVRRWTSKLANYISAVKAAWKMIGGH